MHDFFEYLLPLPKYSRIIMSKSDTSTAMYDQTDQIAILILKTLESGLEIEADTLSAMLVLQCDIMGGEEHSNSLFQVEEVFTPKVIVHRIIFKIIAISVQCLFSTVV